MTFFNTLKQGVKRFGGQISHFYRQASPYLRQAPLALSTAYNIANDASKLLPQSQQEKARQNISKIYNFGNKEIQNAQRIDDFIQRTDSILHPKQNT